MSARTIIGGVGAVVGFIYGGPQGAYYGWAIGSMVGNAADPKVIQGPRVGDISQQTGQEGGSIPIIYARSPPITGNIIASGPARKVKKKTGGGKGGPKVSTETVYRTYAIGVCEGEAQFIRVWRNGQIVFDVSNGENFHDFTGRDLAEYAFRNLTNNQVFSDRVRFYSGNYTQVADPDLEAIYGVGTTPAHRGTAYMVVVDDDLTDMRGAIPQYVFQMAKGAGGVAEIIYGAGVHEWARPSGLLSIDYEALGPGGGGGSGGRVPGDTPGGRGGGGGEYRSGTILVAALGATEVVTVGSGGPGGPGTTGSGTVPGITGTDGSGPTTFGAHVRANAGEGGEGARTGASSHGDGGLGGFGGTGEDGGDGGQGSSPSTVNPPPANAGGSTSRAGPGGGGGGGRSNTGVSSGGPGGSSLAGAPGGGGTKGSSTVLATDGFDGGDSETVGTAGGGGGGGGGPGNGNTVGARDGGGGADGGSPGGGGGGGAGGYASAAGVFAVGGDGGDGADGQLVVRQNFDEATASLADVVTDICARANLPANLIDVSQLTQSVRGYMVTNQYAARDALRALSQVYFFDATPIDGILTFVQRGQNTVATIDENDFLDDEQEVERTKRADAIQIPRVLNLNYYDIEGQLTTDKQTSERSGDRRAVGDAQRETLVIFSADEAARVVRVDHQVMIETQTGELHFALSDRYIGLTPADCIFLQWEGRTDRVMLTKVETLDGYQNYTALRDRQSAYVSTVEGYPASPVIFPPSQSVGPTLIRPLNIPLLRDADDGLGLVLYFAVSGVEDAWQGATIELSYDGGENYVDSGTVEVSTTMGTLLTALPDHPQEFPDVAHTIQVQIDTPDSELEASTLAGMMNRANRAVLSGTEVIQFANAEEITPGIWELSYFLRGRLDTETLEHPINARFVLLDSWTTVPMSVTDLGRSLTFRATSYGAGTDTGTIVAVVFSGKTQTERHVGYLTARRDGTDAVIEWQGVGRLGGGANAAQGARFEGYRVTFSDGIAPDVVVETSAQTLTQAVGGFAAPLTISVQQLNGLTGAGPAVEVTLS